MAAAVAAAMAPRTPTGGLVARIPVLPGVVGALRSGEAMNDSFAKLEAWMLPQLLGALSPGGAAVGSNVLVADFATLAAHDAAEMLGLPLALLWQAPLGMCLMNAGHNRLNLGAGLPIEIAPGVLLQPEAMWPPRSAFNELTKLAFHVGVSLLFGSPARDAARGVFGLPPIAGSGMFSPPSAVPRSIHLVSCLKELESEHRVLPPNWHLVSPNNVCLKGRSWPPPVDDSSIKGFLDAALGEGVPVVYVCAGTVVDPAEDQVQAFADGMLRLQGARFVWSLKKTCHQFLQSAEGSAQDGTAGNSRLLLAGGRVMVVPWAPQMAVLAHPAVRLFVTHGGLNSMFEGLAAGKPLLVTPYFADQPVNAQHVVNKHLGAQLDPARMTGPQLSEAMAQLLADEDKASRAAALGKDIRQRSGPTEAAALLERFALNA